MRERWKELWKESEKYLKLLTGKRFNPLIKDIESAFSKERVHFGIHKLILIYMGEKWLLIGSIPYFGTEYEASSSESHVDWTKFMPHGGDVDEIRLLFGGL